MITTTTGRAGFSRKFLCGAAAVALVAPTAAFAQDDVAAEEEAQGNSIVVTAAKREQTLQEVPVAVSVTSAEVIERDQIRDIRDLQTVVPSLTVGQRQSSANTGFFIRGFGNGANNAGIEPSVGVFIDGVYRSRTASSIADLPNIQRVEVLRGPQSTLFGKNASAGVISVTSEAPQFDFGGNAELTYGNYDALIARAYATGPLSDVVAVSLGAGFNKRDGFFEDQGTGSDVSDRDRWYVRGQLLVDNGSNLRIRVIGDLDDIDEVCCGVVNVLSGPGTAGVLAVGGRVGNPADPFADVVFNNFDSTNDIRNYGVSGQIDWEVGNFTLTSITANRRTQSVTFQDSDFTTADLLGVNSQDLDIDTFTQEFRVTGSIGDRIDLLAGVFYLQEDVDQSNQLRWGADARNFANVLVTSLSSGALSIPLLETVFSASFGQNFANTFFRRNDGFTEAYTLNSEAYSLFGQVDFEIIDGLTLTLGGNYTDDSKRFTQNAVSTDVFSTINFDAPQLAPFRGQLMTQGGIAQAVGTALNLGRSATATEVATFAGANPAAFGAIQTQVAAFVAANVNNPLANPLNPLRALQFMPPFLGVPNSVEDGRTNDDDFTYSIRLAYDLSPDLNVYASYATGFKASSINLSRDARPSLADRSAIIAAGLAQVNQTFGSRFAGPEETTVIEVGVKADFDLFAANLTVFDQEIEGFQSNIFTGSGFVLANAGTQSTTGVEFESNFYPTDGLTLSGAVTWLDPEFDSFLQSAVGDISGTTPAGIAEWTVILGAQYEVEMTNAVLVPRVNYLFTDNFQLVDGLPDFAVRNPDGTIADSAPALAASAPFTGSESNLTASLTYEHDSGVSLSVWGRNITDHRTLGTIFPSPAQLRSASGYPNDPRTYGITGRFRW